MSWTGVLMGMASSKGQLLHYREWLWYLGLDPVPPHEVTLACASYDVFEQK